MRRHLKDYFIPHEGNEYKPHSLQKAAMLGMVALVVLSFTLANLQSLIWISSEWMVSTILPSVIVDLTNDERDDGSLGYVRRNSTLDAAAQLKAEHMASNGYFAHYSPDGISPWYWFTQTNYNFVHAGENLAIHFTDSDEVIDAWMDSPTHRANIMNGDYTEIGVGAVEGTYEGFKTVYVVQLFGTPAAVASETVVIEPEPVVLAETETVIPAIEPVEVIVDPQIAGSDEIVTEIDDTEITLSTDRDPITVVSSSTDSDIATATEVADVVVTEQSVALYSDLISTSTGGIPASIDPNSTQISDGNSSSIFSIVTQPQTVLQVMYTLIGLIVIASLMFSVFIEIRRQHPVQIAYGTGLMAVMAALFYIHVAITNGALVV